MNGLTDEQQKRLSLISCLDDLQAKLILSGVIGILESKLQYKYYSGLTQADVAQELIGDIDDMIAKVYEKGNYQ